MFASFAEAGHRRAVDKFDYHKIIPQYEALYERVLGQEA